MVRYRLDNIDFVYDAMIIVSVFHGNFYLVFYSEKTQFLVLKEYSYSNRKKKISIKEYNNFFPQIQLHIVVNIT